MRYEVQRLERAAGFTPRYEISRSFDAVVVDTQARRPVEREVCVAPWVVAQNIAIALEQYAEHVTTGIALCEQYGLKPVKRLV